LKAPEERLAESKSTWVAERKELARRWALQRALEIGWRLAPAGARRQGYCLLRQPGCG